jgi:hypothetical protein
MGQLPSFQKVGSESGTGEGRACKGRTPTALLLMIALGLCACCSRNPDSVSNMMPREEPGKPCIIATPNPVPAGRGPGRTVISWDTGDGSPPEVYVAVNGGPEKLFSRHPSHQEATVTRRQSYEFRLYGSDQGKGSLATVTVQRSEK